MHVWYGEYKASKNDFRAAWLTSYTANRWRSRESAPTSLFKI
jgi:hypothetical protein